MGVTQLGIAVPNFWFGMLLVLLFAVSLGWFSAGGFPGWDAGFFAGMKALTLPAVALALPDAADAGGFALLHLTRRRRQSASRRGRSRGHSSSSVDAS